MTTTERTSGLLNISDPGVIKLVARAGAAIAASALMLLMGGVFRRFGIAVLASSEGYGRPRVGGCSLPV